MNKRIILHIGTHKTATTSSQTLLKNNISKLYQHDICYISLEKMREGITQLFYDTTESSQNKLYDIVHSVKQNTLILSDENILNAWNAIKNGSIYPLSQSHLHTFCKTMIDVKIDLFLTLRLPHLFLAAMYSEHIRHYNFVSFDEFVENFDVEGFSYRKIFGWLSELPTNTKVNVIPFEAQFGGGPLCTTQSILKASGLTDKDIVVNNEVFGYFRSSYSVEEIELISKIAQQKNPQATRDFINSLPIDNLTHKGTKFNPLPDETIAILTEQYIKDLQYLCSL